VAIWGRRPDRFVAALFEMPVPPMLRPRHAGLEEHLAEAKIGVAQFE
jgi:hypothetical protein